MSEEKSKRRLFRFSLRALMVLVAIACVGFGWLGMKMRAKQRERESVKAIRKTGGHVVYDYETPMKGNLGSSISTPTPPGPAWLRKPLGDDFFASIAYADFGALTTEEDLRYIANFDQLKVLNYSGLMVTDASMVNLKELKNLEWLDLEGTRVTVAGLIQIKQLPRLRRLSLWGTHISDAGLVHLQSLVLLKELYLGGNPNLTDKGCQELQEALPQLKIIR